jgi:hypothetical protein
MIMNDMNSGFGSINPFSRKKDGDFSNLSTNKWNDHPSPINFSKMVHEEDKNEDHDKQLELLNQSYVTGKIGDKIIAIPLIYPLPKVESEQIKRAKKSKRRIIQQYGTEKDQTPAIDQLEQEEKDFQEKTTSIESEREVNVSIMENEFYNLLDESPSFIEETSPDQEISSEIMEESNPLVNEFLLMLTRDTKHNTIMQEDESSSLENEFSLMLEKASTHKEMDSSSSDEEDHSLEEEKVSLNQTDKAPLKEESNSIENEYVQREESSSMLDKEDSHQEDSGKQENAASLLEEIYNQLEESSSNYELSTFLEKDYCMEEEDESPLIDENRFIDISLDDKKRKKSSIEERFEKELLNGDESEDQFSSLPIKKKLFDDCIPKRKVSIVKLPLLLAKITVDIDIFETVDLSIPVENVSKVDWSLQSYDCKVILPSTIVFLKGVLIADVEFRNKGTTNLHSTKISVSWSKTTKVDWLYPPKLPSKSQKEFIFSSHNDEKISSHHEFTQLFAEEIDSEIRMIHFNSSEEFHPCADMTQFDIQGSALLSIDLLQEQFIHLNH